MHLAFAEQLFQLSQSDPRVVVLLGDLERHPFQRMADAIPERFFELGGADARLIQQSVGMALSGLRPIVVADSLAMTTRCLETIQSHICRMKARVVLAGVETPAIDRSRSTASPCQLDLAVMRPLQNVSVVCPADRIELGATLRTAVTRTTATYLRLAATSAATIHQQSIEVRHGKVIPVRDGHTICLLSTGDLLGAAIATAEQLEAAGISTAVVSSPTVKPLDGDWLDLAFDRFQLVVTLEDHGLLGGFGAAVAEWLADGTPRTTQLLRLGTPEVVSETSLAPGFNRRACLEPEQLVAQITRRLKKRRRQNVA